MAAGLRFHTQAGLLTSFITALPFPVSQLIARPLPYTVTASLRIPTGFPFHLLLGRHLCATTLYFSDSGIISHFVELSIRFMAGLSRTYLRQHRTIASASLSRLFAPLPQFQKWELLRSRCQRKLAYGCGIPLAGTYRIPPFSEL